MTSTVQMVRCAFCQRVTGVRYGTPPHCEECARRRRYGAIVEALCIEGDEPPFARVTLDALEALAELMSDRHRVIRQYRQELFEEQREGQRAAREAFADGHVEGQRGAGW